MTPAPPRRQDLQSGADVSRERARILGREQMQDAYRSSDVAGDYLDRRFSHPLGALLHARQARALRRTIRELAPARVLEIAPGPARLTVEAARVLSHGGLIVDASLDMLMVARRRLQQASSDHAWTCVLGDAFALPVRPGFDLVYSFRLIRHFEEEDRSRLYRQIAGLLRPGGLLLFDAVNERVSAPLRAAAPPGTHAHYDALLRPERLRAELAAANLELVSLEGVQHHYRALRRLQILVAPRSRRLARAAMALLDRLGGEPLEWIVTCRRE